MRAELLQATRAQRAEGALQRTAEQEQQQRLRAASDKLLERMGSAASTSSMKGVFQSSSFRCLPGHVGQPPVAQFSAPADVLSKDGKRASCVSLCLCLCAFVCVRERSCASLCFFIVIALEYSRSQ